MPGQGAEQRAGFQLRKDYQPQITSSDLGVMAGKSFDTLIEAIQSGNTERLTQYLAFSSRFHRYSRRNQQLIFSQCPEATRVASYVKWKEEGYHVRKMDKDHQALTRYFAFYNQERLHQALDYQTPAEVYFHEASAGRRQNE